MLKQRLLTVAAILPIFLLALFVAPALVWGAFVGLVAMVGAAEWARLGNFGRGARVLFMAIVAMGIAGAYWTEYTSPGGLYASGHGKIAIAVVALFWFVGVPVWLMRHGRLSNPWILGFIGVLVLVPLWHAMYITHAEPWKLIGMMSIVWMADTAAYAFGRMFGRHKMAPRISPGKTWEGAAGATVMVLLYVFGMATVFPGAFVGWAPMMGIGVIMLLLSIEGDLLESWMKRVAGVKDSGSLLPGHGGVLDRIDALTGALPLGIFALWWLKQSAL